MESVPIFSQDFYQYREWISLHEHTCMGFGNLSLTVLERAISVLIAEIANF